MKKKELIQTLSWLWLIAILAIWGGVFVETNKLLA